MPTGQFYLVAKTMSDHNQFNILQIISNLDIGGAQEVVRTLVEYLSEAGCAPVVCTFKDGPLRYDIERLGIPVEILPGRRYSVMALPLYLWDMVRLRKQLAGIARKYRIEIIQTHLTRSLDFLILTLRWETSVRKIYWTIHNYSYTLQKHHLRKNKWLLRPKRLAHRLLYRLGSYWVDGFIAVSDDVETAILADIRPVKSKITVIANGVDVRRYGRQVDRAAIRRQLGLPDDARLLIMVGMFKKQKGHRYLIEAAPAILERFPDLHIILLGEGLLRKEVEGQVRIAGLDEQIHFLGSRSDVPDLLAASDYFVLPSLWEGLPMALIEAMASGLPIVATDVSGTNQVMVHEETGLLVPPADSQQLSQALIRLISNPDQAKSMGAAARRRIIMDYSAQKQAQEHLDLFAADVVVDLSAAF
jgi:glycosyltransferase involved in cell wall biosynthesis